MTHTNEPPGFPGRFTELYQQWLGGSITDHNNLILRAYALNLDTIADKVAAAAGESSVKSANCLGMH